MCAVLRIQASGSPGQFQLAIVGTAWAVSPGTFVTAHHILNNGQPRVQADGFYMLWVPGNGTQLKFWPVTGFPLEDSVRDFAILTAPLPHGAAMPSIPVAANIPADGTPVLTYGCPAPAIGGVQVTAGGNLVNIQTVLFSHGSSGIVAAQYPTQPAPDILCEFDVAWHHGESGGPVLQLEPHVAAISVMQHYRNIQGPHGTMAGPRRGRALTSIQAQLAANGATFI